MHIERCDEWKCKALRGPVEGTASLLGRGELGQKDEWELQVPKKERAFWVGGRGWVADMCVKSGLRVSVAGV